MTRFVCTGDLHLGQRPDLSADRLDDQRQVWEWILDFAESMDADAVLFAGDAFEGPLTTPEQLEAFIGPLEQRDMPVYAITGNGRHDSAMRSSSALDALRHVPNLHVASGPQWVQFGDTGTKLAMIPWASAKYIRARYREEIGEELVGDMNAMVADTVVKAAQGGREDGCTVLLTHFSMSGASLPNGLPVDQLSEPVIDYGALEGQGWDAVVCGHIHKPQVLGDRGFYVGSPLPLNFGEAHDHGCWLLDVGEETRFEFVPVPSRPVVTLEIDYTKGAEGFFSSEDALDELEPQLPDSVIRFVYTATEEQAQLVYQAAIRQALIDKGAHRVFFKPTIIRANRARVETITDLMGDDEALAAWITAQGIEPPEAEALMDAHRTMNGRLT